MDFVFIMSLARSSSLCTFLPIKFLIGWRRINFGLNSPEYRVITELKTFFICIRKSNPFFQWKIMAISVIPMLTFNQWYAGLLRTVHATKQRGRALPWFCHFIAGIIGFYFSPISITVNCILLGIVALAKICISNICVIQYFTSLFSQMVFDIKIMSQK